MSNDGYERLSDNELTGGTFGKPIRNPKLVSTKMIKAKLNSHLDTAIKVMTDAMSDPKKAYAAAKDILNFHIAFANLEMKEALHEQELDFRKHKNKNNKFEDDKDEAYRKYQVSGDNADIPETKFSMDFEEDEPTVRT